MICTVAHKGEEIDMLHDRPYSMKGLCKDGYVALTPRLVSYKANSPNSFTHGCEPDDESCKQSFDSLFATEALVVAALSKTVLKIRSPENER